MARKNRQEIIAMILSVIAAFALWIYVTGEQNPVKTTVINNVPVQLINTESLQQSGLALMPGQNFTVNLSISGKTFDVFNVSASDFNLVADMSTTLKKGVNSIIVESKGNPPKGINIIDKGYVIKVDLDSLTEKSVPVTIKVTGETKQGYGYLQPVPRPSEVLYQVLQNM
jgi:YbbR domain-containing protein